MTVVTVELLLRASVARGTATAFLTAAPGHSVRDRGMRVWPDPTDPQGFKVHLFNGDDWQSAKDHVARALGMQEWRPGDRPSRAAADRICRISRRSDRSSQYRARPYHSRRVRSRKGTPVERYLAGRGLAVANALRFHPECPFRRARLPAMVAAMVDIHDNAFRGIHRTPLTLTAAKPT